MNFKIPAVKFWCRGILLSFTAAFIVSCGNSAGGGEDAASVTLNAPSDLQASAVSSSQINISWRDNSENEDGFIIEQARDINGRAGEWIEIKTGKPNITTYSNTGLASSAKYYYAVKAYNSSGESESSDSVNATTRKIPAVKPSVPSDIIAAAESSSTIVIRWNDNSGNEEGFHIERSTGSGGPWIFVKSAAADVKMFQDTGLAASVKYYYRVRAYNSIGVSEYTDTVSATTLPEPEVKPSDPSGLSAAAETSSSIRLTWNDNSANEDGFRIERSAASGGPWTFSTTVTANAETYLDTGLAAATKYYYRVRAYNAVGVSEYTDEVSATTLPEPVVAPSDPSGLSASAETSSSIRLTWNDNSANEDGFSIDSSSSSGGPWTFSATVTANTETYLDTGLAAATRYYYRVRAYNSAGNSGYSNEADAVTNPAVISGQIIADHTVVDKYDMIPQHYIDEVKKMWFSLAGESHSSGYRNGALILQWQNPKFAVNVKESGTPETYTDAHLRLSRATWGDVGHASTWIYGYGEEDWFTSTAAISRTKAFLDYCAATGPDLSVLGFGWCWDMSWINAPGGTADPVYGVRWAGSSAGGPEGNKIWGLDSADNSLTGNSVCLDTYLSATQSYVDYCAAKNYPTKVIFTTGPVDGYPDENGYQRQLKQDRIRNYVKSDSSRILFDYADILAWNDSGVQNLQTWSGHQYQYIHADNMLDITGSPADLNDDHIGQQGALRLAKATWWMLARIAGWDGVSTD